MSGRGGRNRPALFFSQVFQERRDRGGVWGREKVVS